MTITADYSEYFCILADTISKTYVTKYFNYK